MACDPAREASQPMRGRPGILAGTRKKEALSFQWGCWLGGSLEHGVCLASVKGSLNENRASKEERKQVLLMNSEYLDAAIPDISRVPALWVRN